MKENTQIYIYYIYGNNRISVSDSRFPAICRFAVIWCYLLHSYTCKMLPVYMESAGSNHRQRSRSTHTRTWSTCMHLSDDLLAYQRRLFGPTTTTALVAATTTSSLAVLCLIAPSARLWREGKNQFRICAALVCSPRFLSTTHISSSSYSSFTQYLTYILASCWLPC